MESHRHNDSYLPKPLNSPWVLLLMHCQLVFCQSFTLTALPPLSNIFLPPLSTLPFNVSTFPYHKTNATPMLNDLNSFFFTTLNLIPSYSYHLSLHPDCTPLLLLIPLQQLNWIMNLTSPMNRWFLFSPSTPRPSHWTMDKMSSPPHSTSYHDLTSCTSLLLLLIPFAFSVMAMVTIEKIAQITSALTATLLTPAIHLASVSLSDVTSVATGATQLLTAPITTVEFVLPLGTSLITVRLNISLHSRPPPSMEEHPPLPLNSFTEQRLLIESGIRLYEGGNVMIFILYPRILLFSYFSYQHTWRTSSISNTSFLLLVNPNCIMLTPLSLLIWPIFHHVLPCFFPLLSLSFLVALVCAQSLYL